MKSRKYRTVPWHPPAIGIRGVGNNSMNEPPESPVFPRPGLSQILPRIRTAAGMAPGLFVSCRTCLARQCWQAVLSVPQRRHEGCCLPFLLHAPRRAPRTRAARGSHAGEVPPKPVSPPLLIAGSPFPIALSAAQPERQIVSDYNAKAVLPPAARLEVTGGLFQRRGHASPRRRMLPPQRLRVVQQLGRHGKAVDA